MLLPDAHRHPDQHLGVGTGRLQVSGLRQARGASDAAVLGNGLHGYPSVVSVLKGGHAVVVAVSFPSGGCVCMCVALDWSSSLFLVCVFVFVRACVCEHAPPVEKRV